MNVPDQDRTMRDIIDDILVRFEMLEKELYSFSKEARYKGRIARIRDWVDDIHDLLLELKKASESSQSSQQ
ncbi:MAG: hypothetical protein F7B19_02055 [Desulfurococcales archaeon]|nr:hypothetical protein [Desulfurococcales archaeon]MCE4626496.1 hypothetical protein [Desulfurococcales archaeon]